MTTHNLWEWNQMNKRCMRCKCMKWKWWKLWNVKVTHCVRSKTKPCKVLWSEFKEIEKNKSNIDKLIAKDWFREIKIYSKIFLKNKQLNKGEHHYSLNLLSAKEKRELRRKLFQKCHNVHTILFQIPLCQDSSEKFLISRVHKKL
jgi:hypothetical protein